MQRIEKLRHGIVSMLQLYRIYDLQEKRYRFSCRVLLVHSYLPLHFFTKVCYHHIFNVDDADFTVWSDYFENPTINFLENIIFSDTCLVIRSNHLQDDFMFKVKLFFEFVDFINHTSSSQSYSQVLHSWL